MSGNAGAVFFGVAMWVWFGVFAWVAPIVVAVARENRNRMQVIIVDLALGWTFFGWIAAWVMAFQAKPVPYPPPYANSGQARP